MKLNLQFLVGVLALASLGTALGQGTIYTSRSAFEASLSSSTTITFENLPVTYPFGLGESSVTSSGATFTTPDARLFITGPGGLYPVPGDGKYLLHWDGGSPVTVLLPGGITAVGADFSGGIEPDPSYNATLTVNLVGGGSYVHNFSGPRALWTFFGVTYSEPISSLVYDDGGPSAPFALHEEMLDNVTFGNVIPESGMFAFLALGGLLLGWRMRRVSSK
ncbi:MAG: hypothetical protein KJ070_24280 [Verrucomicrobia bacterium]|nr:hypothetical protein [Verrucomicrobiota bacterium]